MWQYSAWCLIRRLDVDSNELLRMYQKKRALKFRIFLHYVESTEFFVFPFIYYLLALFGVEEWRPFFDDFARLQGWSLFSPILEAPSRSLYTPTENLEWTQARLSLAKLLSLWRCPDLERFTFRILATLLPPFRVPFAQIFAGLSSTRCLKLKQLDLIELHVLIDWLSCPLASYPLSKDTAVNVQPTWRFTWAEWSHFSSIISHISVSLPSIPPIQLAFLTIYQLILA